MIKLKDLVKEVKVSADLDKIVKMYGAEKPYGHGEKSLTSKTPISPKAYNLLRRDVKVLKMAVDQLQKGVESQRDVNVMNDVVYLVLKAHEALQDMQKWLN